MTTQQFVESVLNAQSLILCMNVIRNCLLLLWQSTVPVVCKTVHLVSYY